MSSISAQKRKRTDPVPGKKRKKPVRLSKKQRLAAAYHSSSEDEENLPTGANRIVAKRVDRLTGAKARPDRDDVKLPNLIQDEDGAGSESAEEGVEKLADLNNDDNDDDGDDDANDETELGDDDDEPDLSAQDSGDAEDDNDNDDASDDSADSAPSSRPKQTKKRNDPNVFATSISKILDSKLTAAKRADPVLSRSKEATEASKELAEDRLEAKARRKLRDDKRTALDKSRVTDVLGIEGASTGVGPSTAAVAELEKRLKKTAQRGVVKLFNAVRAAQVKGEEAALEARGTVGLDKRREKVNEMSKKGFLDLLVEGGK